MRAFACAAVSSSIAGSALAAHACAFREFKRANSAPDLSWRWLVLRDELLAPAQAAVHH
jgi:hypothetical protein